MAVSKRLRFEILRRDNHTCRYCGAKAPATDLRVDHVVPVALGGSDDPENLVAACEPCNVGKSSTNLDAQTVETVADDALRWAQAVRRAADENRLHDNTAVYEAVTKAWSSYRRNQIPGDYRETIDQFLNAGLPADDIVQMAHVADAKPSIFDRWAYFCGCCWKRIEKLQARAIEIIGETGPPPPATALPTAWTAGDCRTFVDGACVELGIAEADIECGEHGRGCADILCLVAGLSHNLGYLKARREVGGVIAELQSEGASA